MTTHPMVDVTSVMPIRGTVVLLNFDDGATKVVDLAPFMTGPVFDEVRALGLESAMSVDPELGTVVWPNGADLPPHRLRYEGSPGSLSQILLAALDSETRPSELIGPKSSRLIRLLTGDGLLTISRSSYKEPSSLLAQEITSLKLESVAVKKRGVKVTSHSVPRRKGKTGPRVVTEVTLLGSPSVSRSSGKKSGDKVAGRKRSAVAK